jgi:hypothetical protein
MDEEIVAEVRALLSRTHAEHQRALALERARTESVQRELDALRGRLAEVEAELRSNTAAHHAGMGEAKVVISRLRAELSLAYAGRLPRADAAAPATPAPAADTPAARTGDHDGVEASPQQQEQQQQQQQPPPAREVVPMLPLSPLASAAVGAASDPMAAVLAKMTAGERELWESAVLR